MDLYEAKKVTFPIHFERNHIPSEEVWPAHWNDVRFNFKPENLDRRHFVEERYAKQYDFAHGDYAHSAGLVDEDHDGELPDPISSMHFKSKRSGVTSFLGALIAVGLFYGYPVFGLKMPQRDNPFWWRKKFGTPSTMQQMQEVAGIEYGESVPMKEASYKINQDGFINSGVGVRTTMDNYYHQVR